MPVPVLAAYVNVHTTACGIYNGFFYFESTSMVWLSGKLKSKSKNLNVECGMVRCKWFFATLVPRLWHGRWPIVRAFFVLKIFIFLNSLHSSKFVGSDKHDANCSIHNSGDAFMQTWNHVPDNVGRYNRSSLMCPVGTNADMHTHIMLNALCCPCSGVLFLCAENRLGFQIRHSWVDAVQNVNSMCPQSAHIFMWEPEAYERGGHTAYTTCHTIHDDDYGGGNDEGDHIPYRANSNMCNE